MFALWISRRFRNGFPLELTNNYGRDKSNLRKFGVISLAACRPCNNTWMSGIENSVKPLISDALFGEAQTWPRFVAARSFVDQATQVMSRTRVGMLCLTAAFGVAASCGACRAEAV